MRREREQRKWVMPVVFVLAMIFYVAGVYQHIAQPGVRALVDMYNPPDYWSVGSQTKNAMGQEVYTGKSVNGLPAAFVRTGRSVAALPAAIPGMSSKSRFAAEAYCINNNGIVGGKVLVYHDEYSDPAEVAVVWVPKGEGYEVLNLNEEFESKDQSLTSVRCFDPKNPDRCGGYLMWLKGRGKQYFSARLHGVPNVMQAGL